MRKTIIAFVLIIALSTATGQAYAVENRTSQNVPTFEPITPNLELVTLIVPSLRVSGTTASYTLYVSCISSVESIKVTFQIQQLNGSVWENCGSSWTETSSTSYLTANGTKTVSSGYSYRLKVVITTSNSGTTATVTEYS